MNSVHISNMKLQQQFHTFQTQGSVPGPLPLQSTVTGAH